jgi:hypothetical protein
MKKLACIFAWKYRLCLTENIAYFLDWAQRNGMYPSKLHFLRASYINSTLSTWSFTKPATKAAITTNLVVMQCCGVPRSFVHTRRPESSRNQRALFHIRLHELRVHVRPCTETQNTTERARIWYTSFGIWGHGGVAKDSSLLGCDGV